MSQVNIMIWVDEKAAQKRQWAAKLGMHLNVSGRSRSNQEYGFKILILIDSISSFSIQIILNKYKEYNSESQGMKNQVYIGKNSERLLFLMNLRILRKGKTEDGKISGGLKSGYLSLLEALFVHHQAYCYVLTLADEWEQLETTQLITRISLRNIEFHCCLLYKSKCHIREKGHFFFYLLFASL